MSEQEAVRRLVKSPPELWEQCSDPTLLGRHLSTFGEIRITHLEPESTVAWEGESVSGTVSLEVSGWGTRVRLTALGEAAKPAGTPVIAAATSDEDAGDALPVVAEPTPAPRGLIALVNGFFSRRAARAAAAALEAPAQGPSPAEDTVAAAAVATPEVTAAVPSAAELLADLEAALDSLGAAHHRPYSRA